jgi:carbon starvation protein
MLGEFAGRFYKRLEEPDWLPGAILTSGLVVVAWSCFILNGTVSSIWPMFGIANQLLAAIALCVGTSVIINEGRAKYAWVTVLPLSFVATTTLIAGWRSIFDNFLKGAPPLQEVFRGLSSSGQPIPPLRGYVNAGLTAIMMVCVVIVLVDCSIRWRKALRPRVIAEPVAQVGD